MDRLPSTRSIKSRKACQPCAYAKRRCDKGVPACKRCLEMEIDCQYPAGRPYACRTKPTTGGVAQPSQPALRVEEMIDLDCADDAQSTPEDEAYEGFSPLDGSSSAIASATHGATSSWFLQADSWIILHPEVVGKEEDCLARMSDLKEFIATIRSWLSQWARDAHCPLLHRHLYAETGLPQCLEEAFAAITMYEAKTEANEEVVMRIIEKSANKLLHEALASSDASIEGGPPGLQTTEHLARVQALFIYQFLRLFGSDIRQRARAEAATPTMMRMNSMMWDSANTDAYLETSLGFVGLFSQSLHLGGAGASDPWSQQWRDWLLAESVRRIWLMVNYTTAVYSTMRDGQGSCAGGVTFTARKGLWAAQSAWSWRQIVQKHDPLFVNCNATDQIMSSVPVKEVDSFCQSVVGIMWGSPKLDLWRAKSEAHNRIVNS